MTDPFNKLLPKVLDEAQKVATDDEQRAKMQQVASAFFTPDATRPLTGKSAATLIADEIICVPEEVEEGLAVEAEEVISEAPEPKPKKSRKRRRLHAGDKFGELTILQKLRVNRNVPNIRREKYLCQCSCGNRLSIPKYYLLRQPNPKTHCGCLDQTSAKTTEKYTFNSWYMMNYRCYKPDHVAFQHYGGRGIRVCARWHWRNPEGFNNFLEDMGRRPKDLSLDRKNNNKGYSPENCRWATAAEQRANQGHSEVELEDNMVDLVIEENKDADILDIYDIEAEGPETE